MPFIQSNPRLGSGAPLRRTDGECPRRDAGFWRWQSPARRSRSEISDPRGAAWLLPTGLGLVFGRAVNAAGKVGISLPFGWKFRLIYNMRTFAHALET